MNQPINPNSLVPKIKLWIATEEDQGAFGDGKWRLLQAIREHGSLAKACEALEISYRKAWGALKKAEETLGVQFLERSRGGKSGGETHLTEAGIKWVEHFKTLRHNMETTLQEEFKQMLKEIQKP